MSKFGKNIVKLSSVLGVFLSLATLGTTQASALELPGVPLKLPLDALLQRGLELEPKLMDDSVNRNNLLLCLPMCALGVPGNTLSAPQGSRPQPQMQNIPPAARPMPGPGQPMPGQSMPGRPALPPQ